MTNYFITSKPDFDPAKSSMVVLLGHLTQIERHNTWMDYSVTCDKCGATKVTGNAAAYCGKCAAFEVATLWHFVERDIEDLKMRVMTHAFDCFDYFDGSGKYKEGK